MLKFRGRFSFPKFDKAKYSNTLEEACKVQMRQAARAWLRAAFPHVPVWTGMARGSFLPLRDALGNVAVPITPTEFRPGMGPQAGRALGSFRFERRGTRFLFHFETKVPHFVENDQNPAPPGLQARLKHPTPWHSFQAGDAAFTKYLEESLADKLPRIKDYIKFDHKIIK